MGTSFDPKQGGNTKGFIAASLSTIALFIASTAALLVFTLSENSSANNYLVPTSDVVSSQASLSSHGNGVEYGAFVLSRFSSLNGPLSAPSLNGPLSAPSLNGPLSAPSLNGPLE